MVFRICFKLFAFHNLDFLSQTGVVSANALNVEDYGIQQMGRLCPLLPFQNE